MLDKDISLAAFFIPVISKHKVAEEGQATWTVTRLQPNWKIGTIYLVQYVGFCFFF